MDITEIYDELLKTLGEESPFLSAADYKRDRTEH